MGSTLSYAITDYNEEIARTTFNIRPVTALNFPTLLTDTGALRAAIENVTLGVVRSEQAVAFNTIVSNALPSSKTAQVELKWLLTYEDTTPEYAVGVPNPGYLKQFQHEIGTADPALIGTNTEFMDLSAGVGLALVTAFEAAVVSPYQGQPRVLSIQLVGRTR